jgi:predicted phage terminase large subunit-like protein
LTDYSPSTAKAILRKDPVSFITKAFRTLNPNVEFVCSWYVQYLAHELLACLEGKYPRMLICVPPRYGKSTIASVIFPAWCWGQNPGLRIMCASYSQELAFKLSNQFRQLVESEWYRELFPNVQINPNKCSEREIQTLANGARYATSVGGPMTGMGGDLLIFDDMIKASDVSSEVRRQEVIDWLENTAFTRLDNKTTGRIVIIGQRLHIQDPIGYLLDKGGWHAVTLPAIAEETKSYPLARLNGEVTYIRKVGEVLDPQREPLEVLDGLKKAMGPANFNAQYQQQPQYGEDAYILWEWLPTYTKVPEFDYMFLSVDPAIATASTNDWSVCSVFGVRGPDSYILHVDRKHIGFVALADRLDYLAKHFKADSILIETSGLGCSLIGHLRAQKKHRIEWLTPKGSKQDRLIAVLPQIEQGHLWVPATAPWIDTLRRELVAFPNVLHDDQVDSLSQFLRYRGTLIMHASSKRMHSQGRPLQFSYNTGMIRVY